MKFRVTPVKHMNSFSAFQIEIKRWWFPFWVPYQRHLTKEQADNAVLMMKESLNRS